MGYAFEMFFDAESENNIKELWTMLSKKKLSSYMLENGGKPHISLNVYNNLDIEIANKKLSFFCGNHKPFNVILCFPGSFISDDNVIFIAPIINENLLSIHSDFHTEFNDIKDQGWKFYLPNIWQPHCTIALKIPENLYLETFNEVRKNFMPFEATIQSIGIEEFTPSNILYEYKLG